MRERWGKPYIWVTWLCGLLAGDQSCEWQAWFKAHYEYDKREDARGNSLTQWRAEHAEMVRQRAEELRAQGWSVQVEDQNKLTLEGVAATLSGKPDLVASRPGEVLVEDCKTGKPKEADYWQVVVYLFMVPRVLKAFQGRMFSGAVQYRTFSREVDAQDAQRGEPLVVQRIRAAAAADEPRRTPSATDCLRCDIATCPDRFVTQEAAAETEEF